jgi:hypothetical protein
MTPQEVVKFAEDNDVKFVDFKFLGEFLHFLVEKLQAQIGLQIRRMSLLSFKYFPESVAGDAHGLVFHPFQKNVTRKSVNGDENEMYSTIGARQFRHVR